MSRCTHPPRQWFLGELLPCAHPECSDGCQGVDLVIVERPPMNTATMYNVEREVNAALRGALEHKKHRFIRQSYPLRPKLEGLGRDFVCYEWVHT